MSEMITKNHALVAQFGDALDRLLAGIENFVTNSRPTLDGERFLTTREVSARLKVSCRTLQDYRNNGIIAYYQLGDMEAEDDDEAEDMVRVDGETHFLRVFYYFWLVNLYAQPYATATADEEPGVPLKLNAAVKDNGFEPTSVAEIYRQVKEDLEQAIVCQRGCTPDRPIRASAEAAHLLLSRVAFSSEDYEVAIAHADSVISSGRFSLLDLDGWEEGQSFTHEDSPETVFT